MLYPLKYFGNNYLNKIYKHYIMDFINTKKPKNPQTFACKICNLITYNKKDYNRHLNTQKHLSNTDINNVPKNKKVIQKQYFCHCGKKYKDNSGLWRHKKICNISDNKSEINEIDELDELNICETKQEESNDTKYTDSEIIKMISEFKNIIVDSNSEFKNMIMDLVKTLAVSNTTNNNTINSNINSNNSNNTFNLQFFLNEQCKDALNIDEFVDSIKMQISDLETTGRLGYVEGVTGIINKNLNELDKYKRPIHCSDLKREVLYVKNNDKWTKEDKENTVLTRAVKNVAHKNIQQIADWKKAHPGCTMADSRKNDLYLKIVSNAMSGSTAEEQHTNYEKIISNVAKAVVIVK